MLAVAHLMPPYVQPASVLGLLAALYRFSDAEP
jgi:hypothetical protein